MQCGGCDCQRHESGNRRRAVRRDSITAKKGAALGAAPAIVSGAPVNNSPVKSHGKLPRWHGLDIRIEGDIALPRTQRQPTCRGGSLPIDPHERTSAFIALMWNHHRAVRGRQAHGRGTNGSTSVPHSGKSHKAHRQDACQNQHHHHPLTKLWHIGEFDAFANE
jgi:hypothetical protein